ncbi:nostrin [Halictus rubicundus]|uniref:nostrin n=1 Tax=Halictus rubicundus TaxID=77578 RepID=UPI004035FEBB
MEEVRHAWASLKSARILSSSNGNANVCNDSNSTTIWYDAPAPVIVHCRDFCDENRGIGKPIEERSTVSAIDDDQSVSPRDREPVSTSPSGDRGKTAVCQREKRHRNTVELTAVASVKTDEDGVPTISFSFLHTDEKPLAPDTNTSTSVPSGVADDAEQTDSSPSYQLYDVPRNSYVPEEIETESETTKTEIEFEKVVESRRDEAETAGEGNGIHGTNREEFNEKSTRGAVTPDDSVDSVDSVDRPPVKANGRATVKIDSPGDSDRNGRNDRAKRSVRSFKSGRKSYGTEDNEEYDAGIASMSGSYSDPECSNDALSTVSRRIRRSKLQKHRLGKAWDKMRSWLRDETTRINEVVNKHARLQAVGALAAEAGPPPSIPNIPNIPSIKCASYDLTRATARDTGSITKVEEFGMASVTEETIEARSPENGAGPRKLHSSAEDLLDGSGPVSVRAYRPCSDAENEEADDETGETKDRARKVGPIKRRMLGSIRGLMASTHLLHVHETEEGGQGGFEDVRRYVKQGGDFCKELAAILHERAELEATYAKGLSKLSNKLTKACAKDQGGNSSGGVNEAWRCIGEEMEAAAEAHRVWSITLSEQLAKPIRVGVAEAQGRSRKSIENAVDKAGKSLHEWRNIAAKSKKQSFACARENERLQDLARLQSISQSQQSNNKSSSHHHHMTEKEASKLEARRRKAEDSSRRADTEFYTVSVRAERARLEYESTVRKGAKQMELLEEERSSALKDLANVYLAHLQALAPRLQQSTDRLITPVRNCNVSHDIEILKNLIRRVESNDACNSEQLLPDFYAEHVTLAMNRDRRKQALVRVLHLIRQDLERERRGREGLETLHRAFVSTPAFAADESTQNVTDKLHHMRSMLLYLEAARYKVGGTLAEVEGSKRGKHPLAEHILVSRDKQGLQQSVLKVPSWAKNESFEFQDDQDEIDVHLAKDHETESRDWADRTAGDGNSENPPDEDDFSDFDEFSSHSEDNNNQEVDGAAETTGKTDATTAEQCRAIYQYSANLNDELSLNPGDLITVHQKQPDGWWIGECRGRTGIFPATYVQVIH